MHEPRCVRPLAGPCLCTLRAAVPSRKRPYEEEEEEEEMDDEVKKRLAALRG